jgi:hypothetical protein
MSITLVSGAGLSEESSGVSGPGGPFGGSIMSIGNSLMAAGHAVDGTTEPGHATTTSVLLWTVLYSGGKLWMTAPDDGDAAEATGSISAQAIMETHLERVVDHAPDLVLVGPLMTNGGVNKPVMLEVVEAIKGYGGTPVLVSEFPSGVGAIDPTRTFVAEYNAWLRRFAEDEGVPYADAYGAMVDPASDAEWLTGYSTDGLHQTATGAKAAGQAIASAIAPILEKLPGVPLAQSLETGVLTNTNPLNSGGSSSTLPTGFSVLSGSGTGSGDEAATKGKWLKLVSSSASYQVQSGNMTATDGDRLLVAFRVKTAGVESNGGTVKSVWRRQNGSDFAGLTVTKDIPDGCVFAAEFPHVNSGGTNNKLHVQANVSGSSISIAQETIINLTTHSIVEG